MYSFSNLEPVCCSMSSSNCCFLTCIQISQEAGQVVWYSHVFQNFPQFIVIHTVKGFGIVNKAEIDAFLELSCFLNDPADVGNLISGSSAFSKTSLNIWMFTGILFYPFCLRIFISLFLLCFCKFFISLLQLVFQLLYFQYPVIPLGSSFWLVVCFILFKTYPSSLRLLFLFLILLYAIKLFFVVNALQS